MLSLTLKILLETKSLISTNLFNLGYNVGGTTINIALAKQLPLTNRFYLNAETKFNTSYTIIPIVDGNAKFALSF